MKYKIGDKVKIRLHEESLCDNDCANIASGMRKFDGATVEILQVRKVSNATYYSIRGNSWSWSGCMFDWEIEWKDGSTSRVDESNIRKDEDLRLL